MLSAGPLERSEPESSAGPEARSKLNCAPNFTYLACRMFSGFSHADAVGRVDRRRRLAGVRRRADGGVRVERVEDVGHHLQLLSTRQA